MTTSATESSSSRPDGAAEAIAPDRNERISRKQALLALAGIVVVAIAVRVMLPTGIQLTDSAAYSEYAYKLADGSFVLHLQAYALRFGLIAPLALSYKLFGVGQWQLMLFPMLCSVATLVVGYAIGSLLLDRAVGLMTALLLAFLPLNVFYATDLHTDLPMSLWLALTFYLVVSGTRSSSPKARIACFAIAGLAFGAAYLTKITALVFMPALLCLVVYYRKSRGVWIAPAVVALVLVAETAVYFAATSDPLYRIHGETAAGDHQEQVGMVYPDPRKNLLLAFVEVPDVLLRPYPLPYEPFFGYHFIVVAAGLVFVALKRPRGLHPLLLWAGLAYLPLSFIVQDLTTFAPAQIRFARTLDPLCVPAMVVAAFMLTSIRRVWAVAVLAVVIPVSLVCSYTVHWDNRQGIDVVRNLYQAIPRDGNAPLLIYSDEFSVRALRFFDKYRNEIQGFPADESRDHFVVVNPQAFRSTERWVPRKVAGAPAPGPNWIKLAEVTPRERVLGGYRQRLFASRSLGELLWPTRPVDENRAELYHVPIANAAR